MIKITVELISALHPSRSKLLGIAHIWNRGDNSYQAKLSKWAPKENQTWKQGEITVLDKELQNEIQLETEVLGFDNVKKGSWDLLYLVLKNIVGNRNR